MKDVVFVLKRLFDERLMRKLTGADMVTIAKYLIDKAMDPKIVEAAAYGVTKAIMEEKRNV